MINMLNIISLHIKFLDRQIYIYNIYNLINVKKININISILEQKLATNLHEKHITLSNFNLYYKSWKRPEASTAHIKKSKKLLLVIQKREIA